MLGATVQNIVDHMLEVFVPLLQSITFWCICRILQHTAGECNCGLFHWRLISYIWLLAYLMCSVKIWTLLGKLQYGLWGAWNWNPLRMLRVMVTQQLEYVTTGIWAAVPLVHYCCISLEKPSSSSANPSHYLWCLYNSIDNTHLPVDCGRLTFFHSKLKPSLWSILASHLDSCTVLQMSASVFAEPKHSCSVHS